jgi:hypothetical protein
VILLKEVCGLDYEETLEGLHWTALTLLDAVLREVEASGRTDARSAETR